MGNSQLTGVRRLAAATANSRKGLVAAFRHEAAFRQELALLLVATPTALWLGQGWLERVILVASVLQVLIVELLNTAVEVAVDRIGTEHHELSGRAKDVGSAAVFLSLVLAGSCWVMLLVPRLLQGL